MSTATQLAEWVNQTGLGRAALLVSQRACWQHASYLANLFKMLSESRSFSEAFKEAELWQHWNKLAYLGHLKEVILNQHSGFLYLALEVPCDFLMMASKFVLWLPVEVLPHPPWTLPSATSCDSQSPCGLSSYMVHSSLCRGSFQPLYNFNDKN